MKQAVAKKWVKALRSGRYTQCDGMLHAAGDGYCCLGVLCRVLGMRFRKQTGREIEGAMICGNGEDIESAYLPAKALKKAGMNSNDGELGNDYPWPSLAVMNDQEKTFEEIADVIEKKWKTL